MRNYFLSFITIVLSGLLMTGCSSQVHSTVTATTTLKPTFTSQPTMTFTSLLPTFTPHSTLTPFPLATSTPFPKDIFDNFQSVVGKCKVKTAFGVVPSGSTVNEKILSETTIGQIWFSLSWGGGDLDLTLLQPDGSVMNPSTKTDGINMTFTSKPAFQQYFIRAPQPGTWTARIFGKSTLATRSAYMLEVWAASADGVSFHFDKKEYFPGDPIKLSATIEDGIITSENIRGAIIKVIIEDPALKRYSFELYDDGHHGDGKADDGVYANTFANTLPTGNYKFYFHLSGLNNRASEPFTRECFLGKTIKLIPSPTPVESSDSKVCQGKIQVSEPVVVRAEGVGGNDSTEYSRVASYPKAISTSAGIVVTWSVGFDGQAPEPNAYMRFLDDNLKPISDVELLFERNWVTTNPGSDSLIRIDNGAVLTFCGRDHGGDWAYSAFLDPYGRLISEQRREYACSYDSANAIWTGSRLIFSSRYNSSYKEWEEGKSIGPVLFAVTDMNGKTIYQEILRTDGETAPRFAIGHGRVLMIIPIRSSFDFLKGNRGQMHLAVHRFDLEGNEIGDPVILDPVPYSDEGQTIIEEIIHPSYIIPTADGWLVLASTQVSGYYVAHLAPDGSLVSGLELMHNLINIDVNFGFVDVIPYSGGAALLSGGNVYFLSADGIVRQIYSNPDDHIHGAFFEHKGHLYVTYTSKYDYKLKTNQVLIRELRCMP